MLELKASADGDDPDQNLWLKETDLFSGRYEGYLRLTDADGDGQSDGDRTNWGLAVGAGKGPGDNYADAMAAAAVLAVESGPVTITYKDSTGDTETVKILIDQSPPSIQIDSPVNGTSSKDDSPEMLGSFTDGGGSGLREESFKVYADNRDDGSDKMPVWDLGVLPVTPPENPGDQGIVCVAMSADDSACADANAVLDLRANYAGFSTMYPTFGIIGSSHVYMPESMKVTKPATLKTTKMAIPLDSSTRLSA